MCACSARGSDKVLTARVSVIGLNLDHYLGLYGSTSSLVHLILHYICTCVISSSNSSTEDSWLQIDYPLENVLMITMHPLHILHMALWLRLDVREIIVVYFYTRNTSSFNARQLGKILFQLLVNFTWFIIDNIILVVNIQQVLIYEL